MFKNEQKDHLSTKWALEDITTKYDYLEKTNKQLNDRLKLMMGDNSPDEQEEFK